MDLAPSERAAALRDDLLAFMDSHVYPAEPVYERQIEEGGDPHKLPPVIEELKAVFEHHRGETEVHVSIRNGAPRPERLEFGEAYRVRSSAHLRSELDHVLGNASALAA